MNRATTPASTVQQHFEGVAGIAKEAANSNDLRLHRDALGALKLAALELEKTLQVIRREGVNRWPS